MPNFPTYFIRRPDMPKDPAVLSAFDKVLAELDGGEITYTLPHPKWQFLCRMVDGHEILLHGTGDPDIRHFEPRQPSDVNAFSNQRAVYASSDGIWPIYFAILDRIRYPMSLINTAVSRVQADGSMGPVHYFFSISKQALAEVPYRRGYVYLLPRSGFKPMPHFNDKTGPIAIAQWAKTSDVEPLARLAVEPHDFPFLDQLRGHDDQVTFARARAAPEDFPWVE